MTMKATFKYKYYGQGFDRDFVYMVYEYRGKEYTVYENKAKGNEPLAWQHRNEQARIDREIEYANRDHGSDEVFDDKYFDECWKLLGWE